MIRNCYTFNRPLTDAEGTLLILLIGWRRGSCATMNDNNALVGAVCHPDDMVDFQKELRHRARGLKITCTAKEGVHHMKDELLEINPTGRREQSLRGLSRVSRRRRT